MSDIMRQDALKTFKKMKNEISQNVSNPTLTKLSNLDEKDAADMLTTFQLLHKVNCGSNG